MRKIDRMAQANVGGSIVRAFVFFVFLFCSGMAQACAVPVHGPEFDALIVITKNKGEGSYHLSLPRKLDHTASAKVYLAYSKIRDEDFRAADSLDKLFLWPSWRTLSGNFKAPQKTGYLPYIHVVWPGKLCDTVANSKFLSKY